MHELLVQISGFLEGRRKGALTSTELKIAELLVDHDYMRWDIEPLNHNFNVLEAVHK